MSVQSTIETKLTEAFSPQYLQVVNESHMHSVPANSETHFKVVLVAEQFADMRQVARHQAVYRELQAELDGGVHALALHTYSPAQWAEEQVVAESPNCMGGSKRA